MPEDNSRAFLNLLLEISRELASTLELGDLLARVLFLSMKNVNAERGSLVAFDADGNPVDAAIVYGNQLHAHTLEQMKEILAQGLAGWVLHSHQAVLVRDTAQDERWLARPDDDRLQPGSKSAICTPLITRGEAVGVLTIVHPEPGFFTTEHLTLLQAISDQAAIAVLNARLYRSLQAAHRRYHQLFEDNIDPILLTGWDGMIQEANHQAAQTAGEPSENIQHRHISDFLPDIQSAIQENRPVLEGGKPVTLQSRFLALNRLSIPVEITLRKVSIDRKDFLQWILRDQTEKINLRHLQDDLAAMIYHDLRSPLSNIISSLELLEGLLPLEENRTLQTVLSITQRSSTRMQRLISSLLDISKLEAGQPITRRSAVNSVHLVLDAVDAAKPTSDPRQQIVQVELSGRGQTLWVDEDMLRRVLINLLENASKFSPTHASISIGSSKDGMHVRFWVQDSGPGITPENLERVFEKYTSLQDEGFPKGLGLGLAFCRLAVLAHGGKIWVESEPGQGSRFILLLPAAEPQNTPPG